MEENGQDILKRFNVKRILWPVLLGILATVGYILYKDVIAGEGEVRKALEEVRWTRNSFFWVLVGFLMMFSRDFAYIWRMRLLTDKKLSWRSCFDVTLLWEFSSAMSPSIVGGSAFAVFMLIKEKVSAGRSTAIVFITIFLDELFYLTILPVVLFFIGTENIFSPLKAVGEGATTGAIYTFWGAYFLIMVYTIFLAYALFVQPYRAHRLIKHICMTRLFKRWKRKGFKLADELLISSEQFRSKPLGYWLKAWVATISAWMSRYLVLNCVLAAFSVAGLSFMDHVVAFARQAVMFIVMLLSPTPGSSGIAEFIFTELLEDLTPVGLGIALAALWRLITYYPYLFVGFFLLPRWMRRVYPEQPEPQPVAE